MQNVITRRSRIVSFRISDEEYKDLMELCTLRKSRSLSDFARLATLGQFSADKPNEQHEEAIRNLYRHLHVLDDELQRLAARINPSLQRSLIVSSQHANAPRPGMPMQVEDILHVPDRRH
jgi:hypothetical protein